jgi:hypothetical protein
VRIGLSRGVLAGSHRSGSMIKKLTVLAASLRLGQFTIAELSEAAGVPEATVRTVIQRSPESWFQVTVVPSGVKGGQPHRYGLTEAGTTGIGASMDRLPNLDRLTPIPSLGDIPLGLISARDALQKIPKLGKAVAERVREDALGSLEWAEREIDGEGFPGDVNFLRQQIRTVRAELRSLVRKEPAQAKKDDAVTARPRQRAPEYSVARPYPSPQRSEGVALREGARALRVFVSYFEKDSSAEEMATFAKVALYGAGREHEELKLVIERVEARELIDCVLARDHSTPRPDDLRVLLCAADETDSGDLRQMLERVRTLNGVGTQVLDYGYNIKVADVTRTLRVDYRPFAAQPRRMQWVEGIIHTG